MTNVHQPKDTAPYGFSSQSDNQDGYQRPLCSNLCLFQTATRSPRSRFLRTLFSHLPSSAQRQTCYVTTEACLTVSPLCMPMALAIFIYSLVFKSLVGVGGTVSNLLHAVHVTIEVCVYLAWTFLYPSQRWV